MESLLSLAPSAATVFAGASVSIFVFEQFLRARKQLAFRRGLPPALAHCLSPEKYQETREYNSRKNTFGFFSDSAQLFVLLVQLTWLWPRLWRWISLNVESESPFLPDWVAQFSRPAVFMGCDMMVSTILLEPVSAYGTFVVEEKFNNHTFSSYVGDKLKGLLINFILGVIINCGLCVVLDATGDQAWFYMWMFLSAFIAVFMTVWPIWIAPLFNTFDPLPKGELREEIYKLISETGLNCDKTFMVDGSKQSRHSNAYVAGLCCSKRIVIYDTLVEDMNQNIPMIKAVVGHEIGHSVMNHNWMLLVMSLANVGLMSATFGVFQTSDEVIFSFGFSAPSTFLRLFCFMAVYQTLMMPFWSFVSHAISRQLEFAADRYAVDLGYDICSSLLRLSEKNLGDVNPDWLHSMYHHSHPPLLERITAATEYGSKRE